MKNIYIINLVDWSKSFVDKNGSFFCGTSQEEKDNTAKLMQLVDLVINTTDLHPKSAKEFTINGGLYPAHNIVLAELYDGSFVYHITDDAKFTLDNRTMSPTLTKTLEDALKERNKGIIVPKGVYFQGGAEEEVFSPEDVKKTFGERIATPKDFLEGALDYIIAPKPYFDATRVDSDAVLPESKLEGVPKTNYSVYDLIKQKYPESEYNITFINTGVVEGICRLHTSIGLRQMFPNARIINISDATTPLYGIGLGYETPQESRDACRRVGKDIGIGYMSTEEVMNELERAA